MANTLMSYNGAITYLNTDSSTNWYLYSSTDDIYFNANMSMFANGCTNLQSFPNVKYDYVTNMLSAYQNCTNLTGSPVCGDNVIDMQNAYADCHNITGRPVCGNNVITMRDTYTNCWNLTGKPVCGPNVTNLAAAYPRCHNLTGSPACGPNVTNMVYTYYDCPNLYGNMYCDYTGSKLSSAVNLYMCFGGRNASRRLNIFVKKGYAYYNWLFHVGTLVSGSKLSWISSTNKFYNSAANIHVYYNY